MVDRRPIRGGDEPRPRPDAAVAEHHEDRPANREDRPAGREDRPANQEDRDERLVTPEERSDLPVQKNGDAGDASLLAVLAATAGLDAVVYVLLRYVPEYLRAAGVGPVAIGAFGSAWLLATSARRDAGSKSHSRHRLALAAAAATVGLAVWTFVPVLADGSGPRALLLVVAGAAGVAAWARIDGDAPVGARPLAGTGANPPVTRAGWPIAALVGTAVVLALARGFVPGFRVVLALATALAAAVAVLWAVGGADGSETRRNPRATGPPHLGDLMLEVSETATAAFVVFAITDVLGLELVVLGTRLGPAAVFGLLLVAELAAAGVAARLAPRAVATAGAGPVLLAAALAAAAFPLVLVSAPANAAFVGAAFAAFGARSAAGAARRRLPAVPDAPALGAGGDRRRTVASGLAPLVGGVLYAVSPVLAFGTATAVGAVGAWELYRTVRAHEGD